MNSNFKKEKESLIEQGQKFLESYDEFTKRVSPRYWRITGHYYSELQYLIKQIENLTEISEKEEENMKNFNLD